MISVTCVGDVDHVIGAFWRTRSIAQSKVAVVERVERVEVVLLIKFMILTFTWISLDPRIWSCRRAAIDSMERRGERMSDEHYARLRLVRQQSCFENHPKTNGSR